MCGIFGLVYKSKNRVVSERIVKESTDTMEHRGPDGWGTHVDGHKGFGHRRLSIIDLNTGEQPIYNEDGTIGIVYNGEIYNYLEIRETLIGYGHQFKTKSDTEVIIHAYEQWGVACLSRFNGMFAWILWDDQKDQVWIVRDRLGIKPLYYVETNEGWCFASEVKAIIKSKMIRSELNERVLDTYFTLGYTPGPETMFKNIRKVKPGHYQILKNGKRYEKVYWDFNDIKLSSLIYNDCIAQTKQLLKECVRMRLVSDVPIGAFLSGGLDSSAVTAMMKEDAEDRIKTFTVGYGPAEHLSEEQYANEVAKHLNTDHNVYRLDEDDFFNTLNKLVKFGEEPIVEPAGIALYHLSRLAKKKVTVILSGEGSDEIFGGYHIYMRMMQFERMRKFLPGWLVDLLGSLPNPFRKISYAKNYDWFLLPLEKRFQGTSAILTPSMKNRLYNSEFNRAKGDYLTNTFGHFFERAGSIKDIVNKMLYVDSKTWLVDNLFVKADKMTMAASLELRVPFMDYRLVEQVASYPHYFKIRNGNGKIILKNLMEQYLPKTIINRTKMGFPVPTATWLKGKMFKKVSRRMERFSKRHWFDVKMLKSVLDQHKSGRQDYSRLIMTILVLDEWLNEYGLN